MNILKILLLASAALLFVAFLFYTGLDKYFQIVIDSFMKSPFAPVKF